MPRKSLNIGDPIPLILFEKFLEPGNKVQLSELKGKAVILDFWNTGCFACLKSFPKIDSLQKRFGNKIQIVLVTDQRETQVKNLFAKPTIHKPDIPIVVEDTIFYKELFPHEGDPLHVWIDARGIIRALTDGYNATVSHIQSFIKGDSVQFSSRSSKMHIGDQLLLEQSFGVLKDYSNSYSLFLGSLNKATTDSRFRLVKDETTNRLLKLSAVNVPLLKLYSLAYSKELFGVDINIHNLQQNNRILIETKNPLDVRYASADSLLDEWNDRNLLSYEASVSRNGNFNLLEIMQEDLNRYTKFSATIEKKKMECLVLIRTSKREKFKATNTNANPYSGYRNTYSVINKSLQSSLVPNLIISNQTSSMPVIDETRFYEPVDLKLNCKLDDLKHLREELRKYDLDFVPAVRVITMLVIRDKKT